MASQWNWFQVWDDVNDLSRQSNDELETNMKEDANEWNRYSASYCLLSMQCAHWQQSVWLMNANVSLFWFVRGMFLWNIYDAHTRSHARTFVHSVLNHNAINLFYHFLFHTQAFSPQSLCLEVEETFYLHKMNVNFSEIPLIGRQNFSTFHSVTFIRFIWITGLCTVVAFASYIISQTNRQTHIQIRTIIFWWPRPYAKNMGRCSLEDIDDSQTLSKHNMSQIAKKNRWNTERYSVPICWIKLTLHLTLPDTFSCWLCAV